MKKCIGPLITAALILTSGSGALSQQRETQPVEFRRISDRLFEITGGQGAQGGAYIGDNEVLIIDAKMSKTSVDQVIENMRRITDKPIKYLVNTHSDGDHVAGNRYFPETVTFIAHENCRKDFFQPGRDGSPSEWSKPELSPFVPSLTFTDKMNLHLGSKKAELWYFGVGHTTGDIVVYFPEEKAAFVGDQLFLTRPQLIHSYKGGNSFEHVKTLTRMLTTIDAQKFYSGHSEATDRTGVENHIKQVKNYQEKVATLMKKGKRLEEIKSEFVENEARLIEAIYGEIQARPDR
jgi:cyclase